MHDPFAHCEALVRAADKDRFLATLFAPAEHRNALFALYAFNVEVSRVREAVRDPLSGEIRLQWWRDVLGGEGRGEVAANPVAAALLAAMTRYALPGERLAALIAARRFDLRGQLYVPVEMLERHRAGREDVAGGKATPELRAALAELRLIARRHLAKARELLAAAPPAVIPALLVLAPVAATLTRMERRDYDPFTPVEIAPWRRQWLIWRAARGPGRMFG